MDMLASLGITKDLIADLIINIGSIVVLFVVVKKLAYKPVKKFMDERSARVMAEKQKAEELNAIATAKIEEYGVLLAECEQAKVKAIKEGEQEALREAEEIVIQAKEKAEKILDKADKKAQEKYNNAVKEANGYIVNLTLEASSQLIKREITDADNKKFVEDFLNSYEGEKNA